jgi:O-antigen/teichoic acid export membrane protein
MAAKVDLWWRITEAAFGLVSQLAVQLFYVAYLQPSDYGVLAYLLAVAAILAPLMKFGAGGIVADALVRTPRASLAVLEAAIAWRLLGSIFAVIAAIGFLFVNDVAGDHFAFVLFIALQSFTAYQLLEFLYDAARRGRAYLHTRLTVVLSVSGVKCLAAFFGATVDELLLLHALESLILAAAYAVKSKFEFGVIVRPRFHLSWLNWLRARALWVLAAGAAEALYTRIDVVILANTAGVTQAGVYAIVARFAEATLIVPAAIMITFRPMLWRQDQSHRVADLRARRVLRLLIFLGLSVSLLLTLLALVSMAIFSSSVYDDAPLLMMIYAWALPSVFIRSFVSRWFVAHDKLRVSLWSTTLTALLAVAFNYLLIDRYGTYGAAMATVICYALAGWLLLFVFAETRMLGRLITSQILPSLNLRNHRWVFRWLFKR